MVLLPAMRALNVEIPGQGNFLVKMRAVAEKEEEEEKGVQCNAVTEAEYEAYGE